MRNYNKAINSYSKVLEKNDANSDYAQYQIGMSYGFLENNKLKIEALRYLVANFKNSNLMDDSLFQLASTYTIVKENKEAHLSYNRLIQKYPHSIFIPKASVRQGLLYYNDNQIEKALEKFKKTTSQFPNSPDALEAVAKRSKYIY
jgi:TolA-binding protein